MVAEALTVSSLLERIRADGIRRAAAALRKPPVPSRLLQELAALPDTPEALEFVAAYPLSPSLLLEEIANASPPSAVLAQLAANPRTPPHLLTSLAAHADPAVRAQAATHPQLPARELLSLAADADPAVRRALAANPSLRLPHQATLITDSEPAVRLRLAAQPGLPPPVARVLSADRCAVVRLHTVATVPADEDLLLGWAASDEEDLQLALLQRRNLSAELCHTLLRSPHAAVRRLARADLDPDDVDLLFLATRGEPDERTWVAARAELARPLQSLLARDADSAVRAALAANPSLDAAIARFFLGQAEPEVCAALALNPSVPADLAGELAATRLPAVLAALAYRESLSADLARFLLQHSPDFRRHWAIQRRVEPPLDPDTARALLADPLPVVRTLAIEAFPGWRRADLYDIARDPAPAVRAAALRHRNAPDGLFEDLLADSDSDVAAVARELHDARARRLVMPPVSLPSPQISNPKSQVPSRPPPAPPAPRISDLKSQISNPEPPAPPPRARRRPRPFPQTKTHLLAVTTMAKKSATTSLTFRDIVLGAEAEVIRQAHEARVQIDQLIEERQRAYERIAALETQVEDVLGETGVFPFPAPPLPVAGFDAKSDTVTRKAAARASDSVEPTPAADSEPAE